MRLLHFIILCLLILPSIESFLWADEPKSSLEAIDREIERTSAELKQYQKVDFENFKDVNALRRKFDRRVAISYISAAAYLSALLGIGISITVYEAEVLKIAFAVHQQLGLGGLNPSRTSLPLASIASAILTAIPFIKITQQIEPRKEISKDVENLKNIAIVEIPTGTSTEDSEEILKRLKIVYEIEEHLKLLEVRAEKNLYAYIEPGRSAQTLILKWREAQLKFEFGLSRAIILKSKIANLRLLKARVEAGEVELIPTNRSPFENYGAEAEQYLRLSENAYDDSHASRWSAVGDVLRKMVFWGGVSIAPFFTFRFFTRYMPISFDQFRFGSAGAIALGGGVFLWKLWRAGNKTHSYLLSNSFVNEIQNSKHEIILLQNPNSLSTQSLNILDALIYTHTQTLEAQYAEAVARISAIERPVDHNGVEQNISWTGYRDLTEVEGAYYSARAELSELSRLIEREKESRMEQQAGKWNCGQWIAATVAQPL